MVAMPCFRSLQLCCACRPEKLAFISLDAEVSVGVHVWTLTPAQRPGLDAKVAFGQNPDLCMKPCIPSIYTCNIPMSLGFDFSGVRVMTSTSKELEFSTKMVQHFDFSESESTIGVSMHTRGWGTDTSRRTGPQLVLFPVPHFRELGPESLKVSGLGLQLCGLQEWCWLVSTVLVPVEVERQLDLSSMAARLRGGLVLFVRVCGWCRELVLVTRVRYSSKISMDGSDTNWKKMESSMHDLTRVMKTVAKNNSHTGTSLFKDFRSLDPPRFAGSTDPDEAENWLKDIEQFF
ncbi:hypothetical protein Taro_035333 [Colocasia esculenta]|uniref:Uncharacterized protein n=1 Tax=Colocasia esculenta TaxID=4460 RepID=A0A843W5G3_COLES|nr:hypothetical protein [Colocasia esculenta]